MCRRAKERKLAKRSIRERFDEVKRETDSDFLSFEVFIDFMNELLQEIKKVRGETAAMEVSFHRTAK